MTGRGGEDGISGLDGRERVQAIEAWVRALSEPDLTFLLVRDALYDGSWDEVKEDLEARLAGRPYIIKLSSKIEEDLERIERLRGFEERHGVDLRQVAVALGLGPEAPG